MDKKILAENSKLRAKLSLCRQELHKERQKNKDISKSRDIYKSKNKALISQLNATEIVKKNSSTQLSIRRLSKDMAIMI
jgi:hypothetical protein